MNLRDWAKHAKEHFNNKKKSKTGLNFLLEGETQTKAGAEEKEVEEEGEADQENMTHVFCVERWDIGQGSAEYPRKKTERKNLRQLNYY